MSDKAIHPTLPELTETFIQARNKLVELLAILNKLTPPSAVSRLSPDEGKALSPKQREIQRLLSKNVAAKAIAKQLGISMRTLQVHKMNIRRKLGIPTRKYVKR